MISASTVIDTDLLGRPFATFRGAQDDDGGDTSAPDSTADNHDDDSDLNFEGLNEGGRKALIAEREAAKKARAEAATDREGLKEVKRTLAPWRKLEREFGMGPDEIRARLEGKVTGDDGAPTDVETIRREAEVKATEKVNRRLILAEVRASATGKFADPTDAHLFLELDDIDVDDDGNVDTKDVERKLADLLKAKPHLAAKTSSDDVESFDGGARTTPPRTPNMTDAIRSAVAAKRGVGTVRI